MFPALGWKLRSIHSAHFTAKVPQKHQPCCPLTPHPSNSHLWDPVTVFSFPPTALTAWIKSTVTCVTTSPILLQTWGEYSLSSLSLLLPLLLLWEPAGPLPCWHVKYGGPTEHSLQTGQWMVTRVSPGHQKAPLHIIQIWGAIHHTSEVKAGLQHAGTLITLIELPSLFLPLWKDLAPESLCPRCKGGQRYSAKALSYCMT